MKHFLIPIFIFVGAAGCQYLPLSKDPDLPNHGKTNPTKHIHSATQPILQAGEFLANDTTLGPDGVLRFTANQQLAEGTLVTFYRTGRKRMAVTYVEGLRQGRAEWWGADGYLKHKRQYLQGKLNGIWIEFYAGSDSPRQEQLYDDGIEILRRGWWPNGHKQFEITFVNGMENSRKSWGADGLVSNTTETQIPDSNSTAIPQPIPPVAPPIPHSPESP